MINCRSCLQCSSIPQLQTKFGDSKPYPVNLYIIFFLLSVLSYDSQFESCHSFMADLFAQRFWWHLDSLTLHNLKYFISARLFPLPVSSSGLSILQPWLAFGWKSSEVPHVGMQSIHNYLSYGRPHTCIHPSSHPYSYSLHIESLILQNSVNQKVLGQQQSLRVVGWTAHFVCSCSFTELLIDSSLSFNVLRLSVIRLFLSLVQTSLWAGHRVLLPALSGA